MPGEVLVIGGGPSGTTTARLLAMWGHRVTLVTRPSSPSAPVLAESLTPSCGKIFDLLGIRAQVDAAAFVHGRGNTVWWGDEAMRVEPFADGAHGWQVMVPALEALMIDAACEAGVTVIRQRVTDEEAAAMPAAFRIDASGRAGVLARTRAGRVSERGHRTVALSAQWSRASWPLPDWTHTLVESYEDGWAWSVPLDTERRAVAVMVDPRTTQLTRGVHAEAVYRAEINKTRQLSSLLAGADLLAPPNGWDASMYSSTHYCGDDWLVTGDAASFVDPLSSSGVKKALTSGWLAAVVVHTQLTRPAMGETARAFYAAREAEMYAGLLALTRRYLSGSGQSHPFWADRAGVDTAEADAEPSPDAHRQAWDRLRLAPDLHLEASPAVAVASRAAVAAREIVLEPRLVTTASDPGVRYLFDVDVVALLRLAAQHRQVSELFEAYAASTGPVDLAAFLRALTSLVARGWLVWRA
ncbi:MAG: tryptophan 7-halogenase [Acidobacteria bacterium]|nr:tryptophan 7-halogenase [Acidobacteriota bacterium]